MGRVRNDEGPAFSWWSRSRGLPETAYEVLEGIARRPTCPTDRILAWARTPAGSASPARPFSYGDQQGWEHLGWHEIQRGGWNAELEKLSWVRYAAARRSAPRAAHLS